MPQNENSKEQMNQIEPERFDDADPALMREDPEYVERPRSTRIFAWVLLILVVTGVILYYLWIAGILHV